jgi:hypothetical protein
MLLRANDPTPSIWVQIRICRFDFLSRNLSERTVVMRVKMGTVVPKKGTIVHLDASLAGYREAIAAALVEDLGLTHRAVKTAMRWTGASERTVKYWLAAERGPSGDHLIALARHSDAVYLTILLMAGRLDSED